MLKIFELVPNSSRDNINEHYFVSANETDIVFFLEFKRWPNLLKCINQKVLNFFCCHFRIQSQIKWEEYKINSYTYALLLNI